MITLLRDGFPDDDALDVAVSRALLLRASDGLVGETFRLHVPGRVVAFGKHDTLSDGYLRAVAAARAAGFGAVERLAGGRAAVFHEETLAFSWTIPDPDPVPGIEDRFEALSSLVIRALARLGIESDVGEIAGEYCPGRFSVHHRAGLKLMGVGQRLTKRAAHVGGVIVVGRSDLVNRPLVPVYRELGVSFDPAVTGALQDVDPEVTLERAAQAVVDELTAGRDVVPDVLDHPTRHLALTLAAEHLPAVG